MRAVTYQGTSKMQVDNVDDPTIEAPGDAILKVTSTAICGSDLHIFDGFMPMMEHGDIMGHEFMGEIVETGSEVTQLRKGDRVIIPFNITCGHCPFCHDKLFSLCDNTNPDEEKLRQLYGQSGAGLFGYSHLYGGYAGGQAEYVRIPFADTTHLKVPSHLDDEKVLFLTDIFPTGYQAAVDAGAGPGKTIAVWGCGPVGQFAIRSCFLLGADRVFAIDDVPERLALAVASGAEPINRAEEKPYDVLMEKTGGRLPDSVIDAVGLEGHGAGLIDSLYDKVKTSIYLETDRPHALREAIICCRKGGVVATPGVYAGMIDKFPIGPAFGKALTLKMGQTHVLKFAPELLQRIERDEIDPSFVITHRAGLEDAPELYKTFRDKKDDCVKVVLRP